MTKEGFAKRWGYQTAKGYEQALFDCREQLLKDLVCDHPQTDRGYLQGKLFCYRCRCNFADTPPPQISLMQGNI